MNLLEMSKKITSFSENKLLNLGFALQILNYERSRSSDPSTKVGAVIVNGSYQLVTSGHNCFPDKLRKKYVWTVDKNFFVLHAEMVAVVNFLNLLNNNCEHCHRMPFSSLILFTSLFPCNECCKIIIELGIRKVVYVSDKYRGIKNFVFSRKMMKDSGVKYIDLKRFLVSEKDIEVNDSNLITSFFMSCRTEMEMIK